MLKGNHRLICSEQTLLHICYFLEVPTIIRLQAASRSLKFLVTSAKFLKAILKEQQNYQAADLFI